MKWTEEQLHELILDLRQADWVNPTSSKTLHRKFYEILKPWFDAHNAATAQGEWTRNTLVEMWSQGEEGLGKFFDRVADAHNTARK